MKRFIVAALLLSAGPARSDPSNGLPTEFRPSFPVFGSGKFVNFLDGDNQAMTNAAAHVGFSLAVPLVGEHFWGRKGLWATGLSWMALTVVQESLFHAPPNAGPGYAAEVRSDLITRLLPCATLLLFDALRGGGHADVRPSMPPERPGMPWPIGLELPVPDDAKRASEPAAFSSSSGGRAPAQQTGSAEGDPTVPTRGWGQAPALRPATPTGCTTSLLFEGAAACSWEGGRSVGTRQLAAR